MTRSHRFGLTRLGPAAAFLLVLVFAARCGKDEPPKPKDTTPPAAVHDLAARVEDESAVMLTWTAPGDDDTSGTAAAYDLRRADHALTLETWEEGSACSEVPRPSPAGAPESCRIEGLTPGSGLVFALRARDETGSWSAPSNPARADLPSAVPSCSLSVRTLDFGSVEPGGSREAEFTLSNQAGGVLEGSVGGGSGEFTLVEGFGSYQLRHGQSRLVRVRFTPASPGPKNAILTTGCGAVACTGAGRGGFVLVQPDTIDFGNVDVGFAVGRSVLLTNLGDENLSGSAQLGCSGFELETERISLPRGGSWVLEVQFSPREEGPQSCRLILNLPGAQEVFCRGVGLGPVCWLSESAHDFGSVGVGLSADWSFRIENRGGGTLAGSVSLSGSSDVVVVDGAGPYSLRRGQARTVTVRFAPRSAGALSARVETGDRRCNDLSLTGTGVAAVCSLEPGALDFESVPVGGSADREFSIRNNGAGLLTGDVTLTCGEFSILEGGGSFSLGNGQSRLVRVRFSPRSAGEKTCSIETGASCGSVPASGTATGSLCAVDPPNLDFGGVPLGQTGSARFTIRNVGVGAAFSGVVRVSCPDFLIGEGYGWFTLEQGQERTVRIDFAPRAEGVQACSVAIGTLDCPVIPCRGEGFGPVCAIAPESVAFGPVALGSFRDTTLTVRNSGWSTLEGRVTLSCGEFSLVSGGGAYSLERDRTRSVVVRVRPTTVGPKACAVSFGDRCSAVDITADAFDPPPVCFLTADTLDFAIGGLNAPDDPLSFTIQNHGGQVLAGAVAESSPDFEITAGAGAYSLRAGQTKVVTVQFRPTGVGLRETLIDLGVPGCSVLCRGIGVSYRIIASMDVIDDIAHLSVNNGRPTYTARWGWSGTDLTGWNPIGHQPGSSGAINVTSHLVLGSNRLRFTLENIACCQVSVSISVRRDDTILYEYELPRDTYGGGVLVDETVTVEAGVE